MQQEQADRTVYHVSGWRKIVLWPGVALVKLWGRTLRFEIDPESLRSLTKVDEACVAVLWHNRLFLSPEIFRRYRPSRPLHALISASRDGAWLAALYDLVGMKAVRGSTSRFGREGLHALVHHLKNGDDAGITPDGPRGPVYEFRGGAAGVARLAGSPAMLFGAEFTRAWRLGSWDRFALPFPFSTVRLRSEWIPAAEICAAADPEALLAGRLRAINPDTDMEEVAESRRDKPVND